MVAVEVEVGQLPPQDSLVELVEQHLVLAVVVEAADRFLLLLAQEALEDQAHPESW
jgi:hypothetical protein